MGPDLKSQDLFLKWWVRQIAKGETNTMSRVNTEECWWSDPRRGKLAILVGSQSMADGMALNAWRLAQEFWKKGRSLVPKSLFDMLEGASDLLRVNLAEVREDMVYIRGSSAYLDWINESKENGKRGGKVSAQRQRDEKGRLLPKEIQAPSKPPLDENPSGSKCVQTSVSFSVSSSDSNTKNYSVGEVAEATPLVSADADAQKNANLVAQDEARTKAKVFVASYVSAYQTRFPEGRPEDLHDGKVRGQILNWIKDYPLERACQLIQVYFQMDTKWFGTKGYDFLTFRNNLNRIGQALDSGTDLDGNSVNWSAVFSGGAA